MFFESVARLPSHMPLQSEGIVTQLITWLINSLENVVLVVVAVSAAALIVKAYRDYITRWMRWLCTA